MKRRSFFVRCTGIVLGLFGIKCLKPPVTIGGVPVVWHDSFPPPPYSGPSDEVYIVPVSPEFIAYIRQETKELERQTGNVCFLQGAPSCLDR